MENASKFPLWGTEGALFRAKLAKEQRRKDFLMRTRMRVDAIFFDTKSRRHEDTKFFVSRKARKGAKTQGNKE
jgi:hypothetical protein